jgi:hypothetical protein
MSKQVMPKEIILKEIIPKEIELLIYEKVHNINYADVMKELRVKSGLENLDITYRNAVDYLIDLDRERLHMEPIFEKNRLLRERLNAIDDNFIQTHFQYCIDCNCCENHTKNRPVSLKPEDNLLTSKKYIQKLKKNDSVKEYLDDCESKCYCRCRYYARLLVEITTITHEISERNHRLCLIYRLNEQLSRLKKLLRLSKLLQGPRTREPEPSPVFQSRYCRIKRVRRELMDLKLEISRINIVLNNHERLHTVSIYEFRDDRKFKENFKGFL